MNDDAERRTALRALLLQPLLTADGPSGQELLLDDGRIRLHIERCGPDFAETVVVSGGGLSDRKGVNVPPERSTRAVRNPSNMVRPRSRESGPRPAATCSAMVTRFGAAAMSWSGRVYISTRTSRSASKGVRSAGRP